MKQAKNILLTFDYEPFLGQRTGTPEKCLLEPTDALCSILRKHSAKAVFFVDVLYLINMQKQPAEVQNLRRIKEQLVLLYKEGHYVFPHLHPHWLDAVYLEEINQFDLSNLKRYSLSALEPGVVDELFSQAFLFLSELGIVYPQNGYRAGGWCIQPFERYENIFRTEKIIYEFSVLPGFKNKSSFQSFDFSTAKSTPYRFANKVEEEDKKGSFVEFPISTLEISKLTHFKDRLVRKVLWKTFDRGWGDGISAVSASMQTSQDQKEMISIDLLNRALLKDYKKYADENDYMHWISHPKMFTKHGLKTFDAFLRYINKNASAEYDFARMIPDK